MTSKQKLVAVVLAVVYAGAFSVLAYQAVKEQHQHQVIEHMSNHCQWAGGYPVITTDHRFACVDYSALLKHSIKVEAENGTEVDE